MSTTMTYEDQRVLASLAARAAVQDLSVRQARAFEARDLETWVGTFVVAGRLELPGAEPLQGHVALTRWFGGAERTGRVLCADSVVEIEGVHGRQRSTLVVMAPGGEGRVVTALHDADDDVIYERGRWYF